MAGKLRRKKYHKCELPELPYTIKTTTKGWGIFKKTSTEKVYPVERVDFVCDAGCTWTNLFNGGWYATNRKFEWVEEEI